ncbi:hypothetical protein ACVI1I_003797 [Bradyrhizobium sp. USDA 4459]
MPAAGQQQCPRLPKFELTGKALAKCVDQRRPAIEENGGVLGILQAAEPDRRAAAGLIGQVSRLAPFQRFGELAHFVMLRRGRKDQVAHLKQPLADRRRKGVEGTVDLSR